MLVGRMHRYLFIAYSFMCLFIRLSYRSILNKGFNLQHLSFSSTNGADSLHTNIRTYFDIYIRYKQYGVPFYYLFPIYGYPKFILGYP